MQIHLYTRCVYVLKKMCFSSEENNVLFLFLLFMFLIIEYFVHPIIVYRTSFFPIQLI